MCSVGLSIGGGLSVCRQLVCNACGGSNRVSIGAKHDKVLDVQ